MGYTHYFKPSSTPISKENWAKLCEATTKLVNNLPEHSDSAGGYHSEDPLIIPKDGDEPLTIDGEQIYFNGKGDLGHETFLLERDWVASMKEQIKDPKTSISYRAVLRNKIKENRSFFFCKTARKPYDLLVCAVLAVAEQIDPEWLIVTTDGDRSDWMPAIEWASKVLGYEVPLPLELRKIQAGDVSEEGAIHAVSQDSI